MNAILPAGLAALANGGQRVERSAAELVVATTTGTGDVVRPVVEQIEGRAQFEAGLAIVRTSDALLRETINLLASENEQP